MRDAPKFIRRNNGAGGNLESTRDIVVKVENKIWSQKRDIRITLNFSSCHSLLKCLCLLGRRHPLACRVGQSLPLEVTTRERQLVSIVSGVCHTSVCHFRRLLTPLRLPHPKPPTPCSRTDHVLNALAPQTCKPFQITKRQILNFIETR